MGGDSVFGFVVNVCFCLTKDKFEDLKIFFFEDFLYVKIFLNIFCLG